MAEKQKVQEITQKLEEGIKDVFESEKYKEYLTTMSKFHHYSFNNTMLIAMQKPDATLVASYQAWQKNFDRHVKRGEKGIRILAPAPYKVKEEQEKTDPVTGELVLDKNGMPVIEEVEIKIPAFRVVPVFDVSQTEGKELPDRTFEEAGRLAAYYSKGREQEKVEIDYVQKKQVKKPAGAKPGFVVYYTNYSLMIDSDISGIEKISD